MHASMQTCVVANEVLSQLLRAACASQWAGERWAYWVDMVACKEGLGGCRSMLHVQAHPVLQEVDETTHICM